MLDLGTIRPGSTVRIPFSTFDKDDGSSITMTNYAVGDILVYKDGSTTERASTNGFTATTDFDGKTGKHLIVLDLADNTTADFWAAGSEYLVALDAVTVDAVTTGGWVARFRIGYRDAIIDTTIASLSSQTSFTLATGPAEDDALNGMWAMIHDAASAVQCASVVILDYTGSTKTVTLAAGATFTVAAKDNISIIEPLPLQPTVSGRTLDVSSTGEAGVDWANVGSPTTTLNLSGTTIKTATDVETDTQDIQSRLPAALSGGNMKVDVLAISTDTAAADNLETMLDGTGGQNLSLAKLVVDNSAGAGSAIVATGGTNGSGILGIGTGTGNGIRGTAGATGNGIMGVGGATSGNGIHGNAATSGDGIKAVGAGGGDGIDASGEGAGVGLKATGGATGHGMSVVGGSSSGDGFVSTVTSGTEFNADISSFVAGAINAAAIATGAIDADALAADAGTEIAAAVWANGTRVLTAGTNIDGSTFTAIPWNAAWDAEVQSECTDALNAYDPPTSAEMDARTLVAASYATAASQTTIISYIDTEVATIVGLLDTEIGDIKTATDRITAARMTVLDDLDAMITAQVFTAPALANAPAGGGGGSGATAQEVWEYGTRTITGGTVGTITGLTIANVENMATRFLTMIVLDGVVYQYTENALELAPGGGGGALSGAQDAKLTQIHTAVQSLRD